VRAGELPEPETIVLAVGSGGTAAGLALGLGLAGLRSKIVGVAITRAPTSWP
jgi:D-cysteine desulfhydrase